jgi:hypothetical protein
MSDLTPETRSLLEKAKEGEHLSPSHRASLEARLFTRIAGGAALGLAARQGWAKSAGLFGPVAKGVAGLVLASAIGEGGYLAMQAARHEAPVVRTTSEGAPPYHPPSVQPQSVEAAPVARSPTTQGPAATTDSSRRTMASTEGRELAASRRASASRPTDPPAAPAEEATPTRAPSSLADETRLLWEADQAVRSGNGGRALALLDEHATRYPDGALGPERDAERIVALCKVNRVDAAAVRGYLVRHPSSSLKDRIQQTCARILSRTK